MKYLTKTLKLLAIASFILVISAAPATSAETAEDPAGTVKLVSNGHAMKAKVDHGEHLLSNAKQGQSGALWSQERIDFKRDFTIIAEIYLGDDDAGADAVDSNLARRKQARENQR